MKYVMPIFTQKEILDRIDGCNAEEIMDLWKWANNHEDLDVNHFSRQLDVIMGNINIKSCKCGFRSRAYTDSARAVQELNDHLIECESVPYDIPWPSKD